MARTNWDDLISVELKDAISSTKATVETKWSVWALATQIIDEDWNQITSFGSPSTIAEFKSPFDFTWTYTSSTTITLSWLPLTIADSSQLVYIKVIPASWDAQVLVNGSGWITMTVSSNVITVAWAWTPFASWDVYEIWINWQTKAFDVSTNSQMNSILNPVYTRYTDAETLVTAQDLTASYADFWAEIDMRWYNTLWVWVTRDVNDSENVDLKVLAKYESAWSIEAELSSWWTVSLWTTWASDWTTYYEFDTWSIPFIQLQAIAGTLWATAWDLTISITKIFK